MEFNNLSIYNDGKELNVNTSKLVTDSTPTSNINKKNGLKILNKLEKYSELKKLSVNNIGLLKPVSDKNVSKSLLSKPDLINISNNKALNYERRNLSVDITNPKESYIKTNVIKSININSNADVILPVIKNKKEQNRENLKNPNKLKTIKSEGSDKNIILTDSKNLNNFCNVNINQNFSSFHKFNKDDNIDKSLIKNTKNSVNNLHEIKKESINKLEVKNKKKSNCFLFNCFG